MQTQSSDETLNPMREPRSFEPRLANDGAVALAETRATAAFAQAVAALSETRDALVELTSLLKAVRVNGRPVAILDERLYDAVCRGEWVLAKRVPS